MAQGSSADREWSANNMDRSKTFLRVYCLLIDAAEARSPVHYSNIADLMGLPHQGHHTARMIGNMLRDIVTRERSLGRPMLTAIVVSSTNEQPGTGFYDLAEQFGLILPTASAREHMEFWESERGRVYEEWGQ